MPIRSAAAAAAGQCPSCSCPDVDLLKPYGRILSGHSGAAPEEVTDLPTFLHRLVVSLYELPFIMQSKSAAVKYKPFNIGTTIQFNRNATEKSWTKFLKNILKADEQDPKTNCRRVHSIAWEWPSWVSNPHGFKDGVEIKGSTLDTKKCYLYA